MTELLDKLTARATSTQQRIEELQKQAQSEAQGLFNEGTKELFATYPAIAAVRWTQYTPYFNDGDECTFSSNAHYPGFATPIDLANFEADEDLADDSEWVYGENAPDFYASQDATKTIGYEQKDGQVWDKQAMKYVSGQENDYSRPIKEPNPTYNSSVEEAANAWKTFLNAFPDEIYKSLFGDHVKVTVTASGVEVEEYEHE